MYEFTERNKPKQDLPTGEKTAVASSLIMREQSRVLAHMYKRTKRRPRKDTEETTHALRGRDWHLSRQYSQWPMAAYI